jgi:hypothetical protein
LLFIHQLRFQTEFDIYKELWSVIIEAGRAMQKLRPVFDSRDITKTDDEIDPERRDEARKQCQHAIDIMDKHKPFYIAEIYSDLDQLTTLLSTELIFSHPRNKFSDTYYDEGVSAMSLS